MLSCLPPFGVAALSGCGSVFFPPQPAPSPAVVEDGNADASGLRTIGPRRGEPNGSFAQAIPVLYDNSRTAALRGTVQFLGDLDVYDLGPLDAGDRIVVDVDASDGVLDASIAIFDGEQKLFVDNDDRGGDDRPLDALIDEMVRHGSDHYYLVIGAAAFAGSSAERLGRYSIAIGVTAGHDVPPPTRQTLLLDFDGGPVDAPTIPVSFVEPFEAKGAVLHCGAGWRTDALREVAPFEAARIAPEYAGQTQRLKQLIIDRVRANFDRFGVDIVSSDEPLPPDGTYSSVMFGGSNPIAFGIAESIDHYNADPADMVVIFTGSFHPDVFSITPSVEELAVAIANVASHEAGHILGLNHVNDRRDLMDAVSPADTLLADQQFRVSPLSEQIMPIGVQDAPLLLDEIVGPR